MNIRETRSTTNKNKRILEDLGLYEEGMGIDDINKVLNVVSESNLAGAMQTIQDVDENSGSDNSHRPYKRNINMNDQTPTSEEDYNKIQSYDMWTARRKVKKQKKQEKRAKRTPEVVAISPYTAKKGRSTYDTDSDEDFEVMRDIAVKVCVHHEMNSHIGMDVEPSMDFSQTEGLFDLNFNLNNSK